MAFDGSAYDGLTGEPSNRLLRPATGPQARARYPLFVLRLKQDLLQIEVQDVAEGPKVVRASRPGRAGERWVMLWTDFEKCKRVAAAFSNPFRTLDEAAVLARIVPYLAVEFP